MESKFFSPHFPFSPYRIPFFYGQIIFFSSLCGRIISIPGHTVGICPFTEPLITTLEISRIYLSNIFSLATLFSISVLPIFGGLFDRIGIRRGATYSGFFFGLTLLFLGNMNRMIAFFSKVMALEVAKACILFLGFFLLRLLGQNLIPLVSRMMLLHWYDQRSCTMIGLTGIFISILFGPAPQLIQMGIERWGYANTWIILGIAILLLFVPVIWATCRDRPMPSVIKESDTYSGFQRIISDTQTPFEGKTLQQALNTFDFWIFVFAIANSTLTTTGIQIHMVDIFREAHAYTSQTMGIFLPMAIVSANFSFLCGILLDKLSIHYCLLGIFLANALIMGSLEYISSRWGLYLFIFSSGLNLALYGITFSAPWPRLFGRQHLGRIMSAVTSIVLIFAAIAPSIFAYARQWGSYFLATRTLFMLSGLGFLSALLKMCRKNAL
ncbi:MAG: MFS transporter [Puniceicoccales bacterium]|jgi:hypothetical protein|nr:MFS transporter [Puniceicoccales bacterium]